MKKKSRIYVLVLIWVAVLVQLFINSSVNREKKLVEQAMSMGVDNLVESSVRAYAYYGSEKISASARETMAKRLADRLGVTSGYEITHKEDDKNETTALDKHGKYGDTSVKIITLKETDEFGEAVYENYIMAEIIFRQSAGSRVYEYKELLSDIYSSLGMEANTNIYMCSQIKGEPADSEVDNLIEEFMEELDADIIQRDEFDNVVCVYGYSPNIDEFVYQDTNRVNVNIAFSYDSTEDITYVHRAIPFVDKSF